MKHEYTFVYRIKGFYGSTGSLIVADSIAQAVALWCEYTKSYETAIREVEQLGRAVLRPSATAPNQIENQP